MALNTVKITGTFNDGSGSPLTGTATFTPSAIVRASGVPVLQPEVSVQASIVAGQLQALSGGTLALVATDNSGLTIEGLTGWWCWQVQVTIGGETLDPWSFFLPYATLGAGPIDLYSLANTPPSGSFLPLPTGSPSVGYVPAVTATSPLALDWSAGGGGGGGSGTVTTVSVATANGFAGTVPNPTTTPAITLSTTVTGILKGNGTAISAATPGTDYLTPSGSGAALTGITAGQVGADASGAASTAQANAEAYSSPTTTLGDTTYGGASGVPARLAGNTTATRKFLAQTGTGSVSAAPGWNALASGDIPNNAANTTGNAGTATNLAGAAAFPAEVSPHVVTLTQSAGSVAVNGALGNVFRLVLTASGWTLANPTGMTDGQPVRVRLIQDGTGGRTISYGSAWDFGATGAPSLSGGANKVDYLAGEWSADANAGAGAVVVSTALGF